MVNNKYKNSDFGDTNRYQGNMPIDSISQTLKIESTKNLFSIVVFSGYYDSELKDLNREYRRVKEIEIKYDNRPDLVHKVMLEDFYVMELIQLAIQDEHSIQVSIKDIYEGSSVDQPWVLDYLGVIYK
ncbi:hypothetical protein [Spirochaeta cellobiosiphila]|uniref:hypothetical protein n=1 Tax=Spirochaeta cellobiosiphila TaxID=504483 RepID=UPI000420D827|nr:hypothetical protein [Spirochaeta cellobiosiphila]